MNTDGIIPGAKDGQAALSRENERLRQRTLELEKALAETQRQRDEYKELVRTWTSGKLTLDQVIQFAQDDDETGCLPLEDFIGELRAMVAKSKGA